MATFYISTTGNDTTGNGSLSSPWKTLAKATSTVSGSGDIIHVNAGTYTETQQSNLKVGVSIEGDGMANTIIKSSLTGDWSNLLNIESSSVTNGNQTISGITLDGGYVSESNFKTWIGIWVTLRSNVVIKDCSIINFYDRGVVFNGNGNNSSTIPVDPKVYTTGNKVTNCTFLNTARNSPGYIAGQINIGGTLNMEISGNTMLQTQRVAGKNGELIKYWGSGYNPGLRILNNTLKKLNFTSNQYNGSGDWNFAIELFNNSGLEIAGNNIQGSIDLNYNRKGTYAYSVWIHDNISDHSPVNTREEDGIVFEFETGDAIVENNKFLNQAIGITFNMRTPTNSGGYNNPMPAGGYSACTNIVIKNNLFANLYSSYSYGNCCGSAGIQFYTEGETKDAYVRNLQIVNNTFVNLSGHATNTGIDLTHFVNGTSPRSDGIIIDKNIFVGFTDTYLLGGGAKMINTSTTNNDIWQCGNNNAPSWTGSLVNTGNTSVNPNLDLNYVSTLPIGYKPTGGSPNQLPVANAGSDKSITLPTNSVSLTGTGNDPDGTITSYSWTKVSGPSGETISTPNAATTLVSNLVQGTYVFRLTVTDNLGATGFDDVSVVVLSAPANANPIANAGPDQSIISPTSVTLSGTGTDPDGSITSYLWTKISGPSSGTITSPASPTTTVTGLSIGTYVFRLTVTDNLGATGFDDVSVVVSTTPANSNPIANAGVDQTITLPTSTVTLSGSGTDSDGTIASYAWSKVSGPSSGTITSPTSATTTVTGLTQGTYVFQLLVTDNNGGTGSDTVTILVNPAPNASPTANAGVDQTITLPTSTVTLSGSGTDTDGTVTSFAWSKVSGPTGGTITSPTSATTTVTGLTQGTYVFRLTVTDNLGSTGTDTVQIVVQAFVNQPPVVDAGPDQTITISALLSGTATDDVAIASYKWTRVSGPTGVIFTNQNSANCTVTGLKIGTYVFKLTVTDNNGAVSSDTKTLIINSI